MQTIEISAKSVQEATTTAAEKLGVTPERVKVTVLEETKGLFGRSTVRVLAEVVEAAPAPAPAATEAPAKPARAKKGKEAKPAAPEVVADVQEAFEAPVPEPVAAAEPAPEPKRGRARGKKSEEAEPVATAPAAAAEPAEEAAEIVATDEDAAQILAVTQDLLASTNLQVNAALGSITGKYVNVVLDGRDAAYLVGKHGEVLNALQYLLNISLARKLTHGVRATLDGNDYRRRREEALTGLATKIAHEVKSRGEEAVLDALPAFERRIVHKALQTISGITTYSEGEEPNRRVVIAPAD